MQRSKTNGDYSVTRLNKTRQLIKTTIILTPFRHIGAESTFKSLHITYYLKDFIENFFEVQSGSKCKLTGMNCKGYLSSNNHVDVIIMVLEIWYVYFAFTA